MSSEATRSPARVTLRDVAREARVSPAAVSRALNPAGPASPAMRDRVARAASKLGYSPNIIARSLSRGRSGIIALIMPAPSRPFYADAVAAAARALQVDGKRLMVVEADGADPNGAIADVLSYAVDGVILVSAIPAPAMLDLCRREARPIVVFNRQTAIEGLSYVACDDEAAGRAAAALLAGRHRCPAFLGGTRDSATHRDRLAGFRTGLRAEGLPAPAMALGGWRYDRAFAAASRLLGSTAPPDAIFCANDVMACAAVDAARRARLAVPRDLSVIGFDDSIGADWDAYRLTTFRVPLARMVAAALEALSLPPGAPPLRLRLPAELVERGSVRA